MLSLGARWKPLPLTPHPNVPPTLTRALTSTLAPIEPRRRSQPTAPTLTVPHHPRIYKKGVKEFMPFKESLLSPNLTPTRTVTLTPSLTLTPPLI